MIVAFDVDGTLIDFDDNIRPEVIMLLVSLADAGNHVIVWSGGGKEYAEQVGRRLGLPDHVVYMAKFPSSALPHVDVAFDDEKDTLLADQMLIVGRHQ